MVRALIIALNFFVAWIVSILAGTPSATVTAPEKVQKGESFTVNVKINPNGVEDFLRFSMKIPAGWTAEKIAEDGSTYMMEDQTVKFLWSRIGKRDEINISFKLNPTPDAEGTFEFPCKLSHSVNNLPAHIQIDPLKVIVGTAGSPQVGNYVPETQDTTGTPPANVTVNRIVPTDAVTGEFMVDVTINKGELGSYIKLQDTLPAGFVAKPVSNDGGQWSFEDGIVRIEWYSPNKATSSLHVQYKVIVSPDVSGRYNINGHVSYVENMGNKLIAIPSASVEMKPDPALAIKDDTKSQDTGNTGKQGGDTAKGTQTQEPVVIKKDDTKKQDAGTQQDPLVNKTPGVSYSIQVAAMRRMVPTSYYVNTYSLGTVNAEQIDGLNKYTTGSFTTYQDARNSRESVRGKGVEGPFVVAYSSGKRITVQEALMITSQKWIR